jgi:hypothetical protein
MNLPQINNVPDDVAPALREWLGEDAVGLTPRQQYVLFLRRTIGPILRAWRKRQNVAGAVAAEEAARTVTEVALATERAARLAAEKAEDTQADADMDGAN